MYYPEDMTAEDIMEFEFEYNMVCDIERSEGQFWEVNGVLQEVADEQKAAQVEVELDALVLG